MASPDLPRTSIDRLSVEHILSSGGPDSPVQAPPLERLGLAASSVSSSMAPPPRPSEKISTRPLSFAGRSSNRLSQSFPVQPSVNGSGRLTPTSSDGGTITQPPTPGEPQSLPSANDPNAFLVALAAQERKVLELKEELRRAEGDLEKLKRQWAAHEGHRKRAEIRHVEPLQTVHNNNVSGVEISGSEGEDSTTRRTFELDRRNSLLKPAPKTSRRKIITGGHTRALSLLSPDRMSHSLYASSIPNQASLQKDDLSSDNFPRSFTMPDTSVGMSKVTSARNRHSFQGTTGVKQIAEDIKAGLFTFMEDLRQATVGDEAVVGGGGSGSGPARAPLTATAEAMPKRVAKKGSKSSLSSSSGGNKNSATKKVAADKSTPRKRDIQRSGSKTSGAAAAAAGASTLADLNDDDWASWDSPASKPEESPRWSGSTVASTVSTPSPTALVSGTRASSSANGAETHVPPLDRAPQRDEIPWPALTSLSPTNLTRTASAFMRDWEKSLTPPAHDRQDPIVKAQKRDENARGFGAKTR